MDISKYYISFEVKIFHQYMDTIHLSVEVWGCIMYIKWVQFYLFFISLNQTIGYLDLMKCP